MLPLLVLVLSLALANAQFTCSGNVVPERVNISCDGFSRPAGLVMMHSVSVSKNTTVQFYGTLPYFGLQYVSMFAFGTIQNPSAALSSWNLTKFSKDSCVQDYKSVEYTPEQLMAQGFVASTVTRNVTQINNGTSTSVAVTQPALKGTFIWTAVQCPASQAVMYVELNVTVWLRESNSTQLKWWVEDAEVWLNQPRISLLTDKQLTFASFDDASFRRALPLTATNVLMLNQLVVLHVSSLNFIGSEYTRIMIKSLYINDAVDSSVDDPKAQQLVRNYTTLQLAARLPSRISTPMEDAISFPIKTTCAPDQSSCLKHVHLFIDLMPAQTTVIVQNGTEIVPPVTIYRSIIFSLAGGNNVLPEPEDQGWSIVLLMFGLLVGGLMLAVLCVLCYRFKPLASHHSASNDAPPAENRAPSDGIRVLMDRFDSTRSKYQHIQQDQGPVYSIDDDENDAEHDATEMHEMSRENREKQNQDMLRDSRRLMGSR
eukprot:TRINITY_DN2109_c0_g1_i1.p1 TRINITY_DN2109_c0_g1~~TRINITY_DN2109_c0_g1_i1.p1  ORF type:complete len:485 (+),score=140.21 TRINITY_DN2109_c0_g1_i1:94-1548(+)